MRRLFIINPVIAIFDRCIECTVVKFDHPIVISYIEVYTCMSICLEYIHIQTVRNLLYVNQFMHCTVTHL